MNLKSKLGITVSALLVSGILLTGAAFAAVKSGNTSGPMKVMKFAHGDSLTQGEKDVLEQLKALHQSYQEKLKAESKALIDQAVKEGKITQEQADRLSQHGGPKQIFLKRGGMHGEGKKFGLLVPGPHKFSLEDAKAKLDAAVKEGTLTAEQAAKILEKIEKHASQGE